MYYKRKNIKKSCVFLTLVLFLSFFPGGNLAYADDLVTDVISTAGGGGHTIVLKSDGTVWAWGKNFFGQLGNGDTLDSIKPVKVYGLSDIKEIAAGSNYSIALDKDGSVWAWGCNSSGELGDGTRFHKYTPVKVLTGVQHITSYCGLHTMVLKKDGTVWAWGANHLGQLGDGTIIDRLTPVQVTGLSNVKEIAAGGLHSMALKYDGTVWAWGYNDYGQLGDGAKIDYYIPILTPIQVPGLSNVTKIASGPNHSIALQNDGTVWTWGSNGQYQLGYDTGSTYRCSTPQRVPELSDIKEIEAGELHTIALKNDGTVYTWGMNYDGQLGDGTTIKRKTPQKVNDLPEIKTIAGGYSHTIALQNNGTIWAWGYNEYGQTGNQKKSNVLTPEKALGLDLPKPEKINVYNTKLPNKTMQLKVTADMDDGSEKDITTDVNTSYVVSNPEVASINNNGLVSIDPYADEDDFTITVFYKNFYKKVGVYHIRKTATGDMEIYKEASKGTFYIFKMYKHNESISQILIDSIRNVMLGYLGDYGDVLNLVNEINRNNDDNRWKDGSWQIKIPSYAIGETFHLNDDSYSSYSWTSIEGNKRLKNCVLACGNEVMYIVTDWNEFTIYVCDGVYDNKE
ncbi:hypothetical protein [Desulfitobacterium sp. PCE1]|uniref:RCC1 domain-containing protein n=1 Tax=Desulfitobacterium sp. PCE1 TaxID=146907 RepID=UPI00037E3FA8|nr:hypothetical protein [Desulfitobacterium sp. PCE1]